jgi:hypothetical protein
MRSVCGAYPMVVRGRREILPHTLFPVFGGWACLRCRLPVALGRGSSDEVAQCLVPEVFGLDGLPCLSTRLELQRSRNRPNFCS